MRANFILSSKATDGPCGSIRLRFGKVEAVQRANFAAVLIFKRDLGEVQRRGHRSECRSAAQERWQGAPRLESEAAGRMF